MTGINRKLRRETTASIHSQGRRRAVIVSMSPGGDGTPGPSFLGFRLHGTRTTYYLPVDYCWREAARAELARRRLERRKKRKGAA